MNEEIEELNIKFIPITTGRISRDRINKILKREYGYSLIEFNIMLGHYIEQTIRLKKEINRLKGSDKK